MLGNAGWTGACSWECKCKRLLGSAGCQTYVSLMCMHLQHLRQVKVVQGHHWRDAGCLQLLQEAGIEVQGSCVGCSRAATARQYA